ncbi:hypothetical protein [Geodermatophilus sp. URMC 65]
MLVDWSPEFDQWLGHVEAQGGRVLEIATALLQALMELQQKPEESATFKRVWQAKRHELWRVAHPYDPEAAVRIICWFPSDETVVVALVGFDKKSIGDVFYTSAAARGEALVDQWIRQHQGGMQ